LNGESQEERMNHFYRKPIFLGIVLAVAGLIGCSNPYEPPISAPLAGERAAGNGGGVAAPIPIISESQFESIGKDPNYPLNGDYILAANLTLVNWVPIGDELAPFTGAFYGGSDYTITLQSFDAKALATKSYLGIFGYVTRDPVTTANAELHDLTIVVSLKAVSDATTGQAVGVLAGYTENTEIDAITLIGSFGFQSPNTIYVGGIVGYAHNGTVIQNSASSAAMYIDGGNGGALVTNMFYNTVGGIVGLFKGEENVGVDILNCQNTGNVTADCTTQGAQVFAGGIAGGSFYYFTDDYQGSIQDCSSTGTITANCTGFWSWAGGIAGVIVGGDNDPEDYSLTTRIERCYATGTVTVENSGAGYPYVGGIVGYNYFGALVSQCWFYGNVLSNTDGNYTGGIAGYNSQTTDHNSRIEDCWSAGLVQGLHNAGGIVGQNQVNTYVQRCYSRATVNCLGDCDVNAPSTNPGVGGIAGFNASGQTDAITACVALNSSVSAGSGSSIHRIVGNNSGNLSNNLARILMPVNTNPQSDYDPVYGPDEVDGENTVAQPDQSVYADDLGWDFTVGAGVWEMNPNGYPQLQWQTFYPSIPAGI
jgi:hypothetical protein